MYYAFQLYFLRLDWSEIDFLLALHEGIFLRSNLSDPQRGDIGAGMRIRIRSDSLIFGPPDPVFFSTDPEPAFNNGFIKLFSSLTKYKPESTNSSIK